METLTLTLVQPDLQWQQAAENREILGTLLKNHAQDTDLIILPEMFTSAFTMDAGAVAEPWPGESVDWMLEIAVASNAAVTGSIAVMDDNRRYNRLVFVSPEGGVVYYDKRHLFRMMGEHKRYAAGEERAVLIWRGWRILPLVCYDLRFPVWSRNTSELAYDLLLYVANWPAARNNHWQTLLQARAIENLAFTVGVNRVGEDGNGIDYVGHSMITDPAGEILLDCNSSECVQTLTLDKSRLDAWRRDFPAHMDADGFELQ